MRTLWQDIRYGFRMLARNPGFTTAVVLILALGIGANTAIFSVVNAVLLRPLPCKEPNRIVQIWETNIERGMHGTPVSPLNFLDWKDRNQVFEHMGAYCFTSFNLTGVDEPKTVKGTRVSGGFFNVLGIGAMLGRTFSSDDCGPGSDTVAVLSHGLWQRCFGSDPSIMGRTLTLDGKPHSVIGIMPPNFCFPRNWVDVWVPLVLEANDPSTGRGKHYLSAMALLRANVTVKQAQAEMDAISRQLEQEYPYTNAGFSVTLVPLHDEVVGSVRTALFALLGAVSFVLLIACANVANMLLARNTTRQKEMAIRSALGAGRLRLIRQLLVESLVLSLLAAPFGVLLSLWGIDVLAALSPRLPHLGEIGIDARVLSFAAGISLLAAALFGLLPALLETKVELSESLKEGTGRSSCGLHGHRVRSLLLVSEVALAFVLLIGAGLMLKSFRLLMGVELGFEPTNVLTIGLHLPHSKYPEAHHRAAFHHRIIEQIGKLPGVHSIGATHILPLTDNNLNLKFAIEGAPPAALGQGTGADYRRISHNYFRTMRIPLLTGRVFTERDTDEAPAVAIINKTMAQRFFPEKDPLGQRIIIWDGGPNPREIIGVVGDVRYRGLHASRTPMVYVPYAQCPQGSMFLVIRTVNDPKSIAPLVRSGVWTVDKEIPVSSIRTMEQILKRSVSRRRFNILLLEVFAVAALILASVGIYGVVAYSVSQRIHEIGIRMALGAQTRDVLQMVIKQGLILALIGVAVGLAAALALTRVISSLLYEVSPTDPVIFVCVSLFLTGVALLASYIPARRATKIDPMVALRYE